MEWADENVAAAKLLLDNRYPGFAASRAYYAMFLTAEALLLSKDLSFSKHSAVISAFAQHFAKTDVIPADFHRFLLSAQNDRLKADYTADESLPSEDAETHVTHAIELIQHARRILGLSS